MPNQSTAASKSNATVRVVNRTRGTVLATQAHVANTFWTRLCGLLGRAALPAGHGLVLYPTSSVHGLMMRFDIDVLHLDRNGRVLRTLEPLRRNRLGPLVRGGYYAVELPAGTITATGTRVGDDVAFQAPLPPAW